MLPDRAVEHAYCTLRFTSCLAAGRRVKGATLGYPFTGDACYIELGTNLQMSEELDVRCQDSSLSADY